MKSRRQLNERGGALIVTILLMLLLGCLAATLLTVQLHRDRLKRQYSNKISSVYNAEGALNYGVEVIWNGFLGVGGGKPGKLGDLQTFLSSKSVVPIPANAWVKLPLAALKLSPGATAVVDVYRTDNPSYTDLRFRSAVTLQDHTETVESTFRAEGHSFSGFNFALLSNNISCTFCHMKIDSVEKWSGKPYQRVRAAALESLMIRTGSADTTIAGTLYTGGKLMDKSGVILTDLTSSSVDGYSFTNYMVDPKTTKLVNLTTAPTGTDGNPVPGYNLYLNYPKDPAKETDGKMPSDFPPVFGDDNSNRIVDDAEYQKAAQSATGKASGLGFVVPKGSTFSGSLTTTNPVSLNGSVDGNLILTGTAQNPIRLDGKIVVDGDVVIQGVVKGTGSIEARGNVYLTGDLTYNDAVVNGVRQFGVAADGTKNGLGLAAGGNVLIGDYLTSKGGSVTDPTDIMTGLSAGGFGFTFSELSIFNRREWSKTQSTLPGSRGTPVKNSSYMPGYKPKYYALAAGNPVYVYTKGLYWDDAKQTWLGSEHAGNFTDMSTVVPVGGSVITTLNPTSPWITPKQLKSFWMADEAKRVSGSPFKIDGLIYTDTSVFALARGSSKSDGNVILNGALVARDTGILAGGSLSLYYDQRVTDFLDIKDSTDVVFSRVLNVRRMPVISSN